ncbi:hypothetical protein E2605_07710 [Dysgonomonas capnocytophagoides]|uniref:Uncharacterized protein n=1 Tax=Dysgonomonas capnocytophagoides TaxID=45254 RepID=A0A4Y8L333_9BACT|nr:hypothetical protein [Dysgonomonas capnocytophagoides]TFD96697.1 hypothetical protein E2605_07710 [Dysgonomonas capnocytophagoides]
MIQLTEKVFAVEVPSDATDLDVVSHLNKEYLVYFSANGHVLSRKKLTDSKVVCSLIGVTPLSEEQWEEVVDSKQIGDMTEPRWRDHQYGEFILYGLKTATESGLSLLESKGLDVNKKYAIIKIE